MGYGDGDLICHPPPSGERSAVPPAARGANRAKKSGLLGAWTHAVTLAVATCCCMGGWMELSVLGELILVETQEVSDEYNGSGRVGRAGETCFLQ